jgi:hypothetical protein
MVIVNKGGEGKLWQAPWEGGALGVNKKENISGEEVQA